MNLLRIFAVALVAVLALACGDDDDDEHDFDTYSECYAHELEHGSAEAAFTECDGHFTVVHANIDACNTYYSTMDIPTTDISAHCNELFPPAT